MSDPKPANPGRAGLFIVLAVIIGAILVLVSWLTRFPWDYLGQ